VGTWRTANGTVLSGRLGFGSGVPYTGVEAQLVRRLADPRKASAGGLAVALADALNRTGGLWFGWSGNVIEGSTSSDGALHIQQAGKVTLAAMDLSRQDHDSYYLGFSNGVLWPVFHYRLDLAHFEAGYIGGYRRVNQLFARQLKTLLRPDDIIWVHDYHLIPLAAELRALGCQNRIGFFLHTRLLKLTPCKLDELRQAARQILLKKQSTNTQCMATQGVGVFIPGGCEANAPNAD
jgi:hypothetical protein